MLEKLIQRGDYVAMEQGRLVITPQSGKPIPKDWMKKYQSALVAEIAKLAGVDVFEYRGYSTGRYGEHKAESLRLEYVNLVTGAKCAAIFNVMLTRERARRNYKKGDPLPDKQFRTTENYVFVAVWKRLAIELPRSQTEWHDNMGKLKPVFVVASLNDKGKLANDTISPFAVSLSEIENLIGEKSPDKNPIASRYAPDNSPIRTPDKETAQTHTQQGFQANLSTCANKDVLSKQVSACKESLASPSANPYRELESKPFVTAESRPPQEQSLDEWLADYDAVSTA